MPYELIVALRYLRDGRYQTVLILSGVGVGVAVIIFLSALINGLQQNLVDTTLGTQAHIIVRSQEEMPRELLDSGDGVRSSRVERPAQRVRSIVGWQQAVEAIQRLPDVTAVAPAVSGSAIAVRGAGSFSVAVRGIDPDTYGRIIDLESRIQQGSLDLTGFRALIGVELANDLGLQIGSRLRLRTADGRDAVYTVSGIFDLDNQDLNQRWVFVPLRAAQTLFALDGGVSRIEVQGREIFAAEDLAGRITERTGLLAESWMTTNRQLLVGLRSQSASSYMIQAFVILAVALGIASVLAVSVVQKSKEIGILRATGTRRRQVTRIFLLQGGLVGLTGSLAGIILGALLALSFATTAQNPDGSPTFPVDLSAILLIRATLTALVVGVGAAVLPARRAAAMDPATAIRSG